MDLEGMLLSEYVKHRNTNTLWSHLYVESNINKQTKLHQIHIKKEVRLVVTRGMGSRKGKLNEGSRKLWTSSYKINKY